jgi:hypothetical protein
MNNEVIQETRKEWSTPELKKVDIEQITAAGDNSYSEGLAGS